MVNATVSIHSPQRQGVGGRENPDRAEMGSLALPNFPPLGEGTELNGYTPPNIPSNSAISSRFGRFQ
jgi:hypothetical protein